MSSHPQGSGLYAPTNDERTFALLVYVLGVFSGFLAPLVLFLIKRDSKFVSFHALQALAWHAIYFVLIFGGMMIFFISMIFSLSSLPAGHNGPPAAFFSIFAFVWLFAMGGWLVNLILGIVYGIKANKGEWAQLPLVGGWILNKVVFS